MSDVRAVDWCIPIPPFADVPEIAVTAAADTAFGPPTTIADLTDDTCRWPVGHPKDKDFRFCGAPSLPRKPYCECHWRIAWRRREK
jgi:hypothetical protein